MSYCAQFWTLHFKKDADKLAEVQRRAARVIRELEPKFYEKRKNWPCLALRGKKRGDLIALFKYLKCSHTEEGLELISIIPECQIHNNRVKLQEARLGRISGTTP